MVGAGEVEPPSSSVSAKHREPLCYKPFSQVGSDRRGGRETLSFGPSTLPLPTYSTRRPTSRVHLSSYEPAQLHPCIALDGRVPLIVIATGVALGGHGCALAAVVPVVAAAAASSSSGPRAAERIRPQPGSRLPASHRRNLWRSHPAVTGWPGCLVMCVPPPHSATTPMTRLGTGWTPPR